MKTFVSFDYFFSFCSEFLSPSTPRSLLSPSITWCISFTFASIKKVYFSHTFYYQNHSKVSSRRFQDSIFCIPIHLTSLCLGWRWLRLFVVLLIQSIRILTDWFLTIILQMIGIKIYLSNIQRIFFSLLNFLSFLY